jgi:hypothetical protein
MAVDFVKGISFGLTCYREYRGFDPKYLSLDPKDPQSVRRNLMHKPGRINWLLVVILVAVADWLGGSTVVSQAQIAGANAVTGPGSPAQVAALAFVDASTYSASGTDICTAIGNILYYYTQSSAFSNGIVNDARGISSSNLNCASSTYPNPWSADREGSYSTSGSYNNIVLLPVGTIKIPQTWILAGNTHLIGQGSNLTVIQASSGFSGDIIDMGGPGTTSNSQYCGYSTPTSTSNGSWYCEGVVIEHVGLDGGGNTNIINGIVNQYSQELSYVDDVALTRITGTGLILSGGSMPSGSLSSCPGSYGRIYCVWGSGNSGPYTNISYSGSGACAYIFAGPDPSNGVVLATPSDTRGIQGLICNTTAATGAVIYVDSPNNDLEDISISGAGQDGIQVGDSSAAHANILFNISGSGLANLIHIKNATPGTGGTASLCQPGNTTNPPNACDVTILGARQISSVTNTVQDDLTNTTVTDSSVGMYVLGEMIPGGVGYSRFTTSPNWPSWSFGTGTVSGACPKVGSLYSLTSGSTSTGSTLYGCQGQSSGGPKWALVTVH